MNVWSESSAVDRICKTFANSVEEAKEFEKRDRKKTGRSQKVTRAKDGAI